MKQSPRLVLHISISSLVVLATLATCQHSLNDTSLESQLKKDQTAKILSRRKRFLVFPEGSSLQLVFCLTHASVSVIGDIFLWGNTAALAWELPQDPYSPFNHHADPLHRRQDVAKSVYYTDTRGKVLFKVPYKRKPLVNPAFAKRSIHDIGNAEQITMKVMTIEEQREKDILDRKKLHEKQVKRDFLKMKHMDEKIVDFHRQSRKGLYEKLEVFLKALGMNGRQCVLRTLCEVGQSGMDSQGPFMEEMLRAIFTLPKGHDFDKPVHHEYDLAHDAKDDCRELYPECATNAHADC